MPQKGQIACNPISGDTYEFLETAADTRGERVKLKATIKTIGRAKHDNKRDRNQTGQKNKTWYNNALDVQTCYRCVRRQCWPLAAMAGRPQQTRNLMT